MLVSVTVPAPTNFYSACKSSGVFRAQSSTTSSSHEASGMTHRATFNACQAVAPTWRHTTYVSRCDLYMAPSAARPAIDSPARLRLDWCRIPNLAAAHPCC